MRDHWQAEWMKTARATRPAAPGTMRSDRALDRCDAAACSARSAACRYHLTGKIRQEMPMVSIQTTQLSSKGQVVIPEEIRERLGLKPGSRFVVVAERGVVIFKVIESLDLSGLEPLIATARKQARKAGLKKADVSRAVKRARSRG